MDAGSFEELVGCALDALLEQVADRIEEVAVVVEDEPPRRAGERHCVDGVLLARCSGSSLTRRRVRGRGSISRMPDIIKLYHGPIERVGGGDGARIADLIDATLRRETSRYFGVFSEPDRAMDDGWAPITLEGDWSSYRDGRPMVRRCISDLAAGNANRRVP